VPLVQGAAPRGVRVLPAGQVRTEGSGVFCRTDQSADRGITVIWLPDRGAPAGVQQEHSAADLPAEGLAGLQATDWLSASRSGHAVGRYTPNERWSTDVCRVWAGRDDWATLALAIDCQTRELRGWQKRWRSWSCFDK